LFGAALSAALEPVGPYIAKASNRIVGTPAKQLTGLREVEFQTTTGKETVVTRFTQPKIESTRLSKSALEQYQKQTSLARNIKMELSGTETVTTIAPNEKGILTRTTKVNVLPSEVQLQKGLTGKRIKVVPERTTPKGPVETTRSAEPVLAATKGETLYARKNVEGDVSKFLKTPTTGKATESVKLKIDQVNLRQSSGNRIIDTLKGKFVKDQPTVVLEKTVITGKDAILPTSKTTTREFTGIKLTGQVDPLANLKAAKALPQDYANQIYKSLGGNYRPMIEKIGPTKTLRGSMKPLGGSRGSVEPGARIAEQFKTSQEQVKQGFSVREYQQITKGSKSMKPGTNEFFKQGKAGTITESINKQVNTGKQTITIERPIIEVNPTKGSAWSTTSAAASSIWGTKQASNQRQRQATGSNILERSAQNVRPTVDTPQRISPVLTTPSVFEPGKIDQARIIDIPEPQQQDRPSTPIRWSGPKLPVPIDRPTLFEPPHESIKHDGGPMPPIITTKPIPIETTIDFTGVIRIPDNPPAQPQTTDVPQIFRTSSVPKRKLQGLTIFPGGGGSGSGGMFGSRKGKWWKTKSPFPEPGQVFKQVLGKKNIDVFKQVKARKVSKKKRASSGSGNRRSRKR
jgi:hypothetical protein